MSITPPAAVATTSPRNAAASAFEQNLNAAKSSQILVDYMKQSGKSAINAGELTRLANASGNVPSDVSAAASYMTRHSDVFTAIETHDVAGKDGLSGVWNFEWAAGGGLQNSSVEAMAAMTDAFDRAISASAEITEVTTGKKTEIDATKQRPQN